MAYTFSLFIYCAPGIESTEFFWGGKAAWLFCHYQL
jgi:hypothetical protein